MGNEPSIMAHGGETLHVSPNINESTTKLEPGHVPTQYHLPSFPIWGCPQMIVPPEIDFSIIGKSPITGAYRGTPFMFKLTLCKSLISMVPPFIDVYRSMGPEKLRRTNTNNDHLRVPSASGTNSWLEVIVLRWE